LWTPRKFSFEFIKGFFLREVRMQGLWVGQIIALPAKNLTLADLAVLSTSDNKLIVYRFKRRFLWGMYQKRRKVLWAKT